jgi:poly-gamma-glutamate capsule biosynthesis protein CapA/YwtB (metallophosphatase superfamily)
MTAISPSAIPHHCFRPAVFLTLKMDNNKLVIGLTGDIMIGRGVNLMIAQKGYSYIWGNTLPLLLGTDLNIVNLETALTNSTSKKVKTFNFKAGPDKVRSLTRAGVTVVNLANNHILDFSEEGLIDTIHTLNSAGIKYAGAGLDYEEAARPVILNRNEIMIGVLGFTDNEPEWKAGPSCCGVHYIDISVSEDRHGALLDIAKLKKESDIVIVSIHWGPNRNEFPEPHFIDFAHEMVEQGADIIHGHSAHNFQGIEIYNHKLILYDTGDFVDDYMVDSYFKNDHSFFFRVEVSKQGIAKLELIPVLISACQVNLSTADDFKWSIERMQYLSGKFGTNVSDQGEVVVEKKEVILNSI